MGSRLGHGIQVVAGLVIVGFVARYVIANWGEVREADLAWRVSVPLLMVAVVTLWAVFALLADAWRRTVAAWGRALGWLDAASIWLLSSMAKYVPGKVWTLAGMAVMAERRGVPAWAATGSAVILQVLSLGTGALVVAGAGLLAGTAPGGVGATTLVAVGGGSLAVTVVALWPPFTRRLVAAVAPAADLTHIPGLAIVGQGALANALAWVGHGTIFWLIARGTLPDARLGLAESVAAYTASYVAGVIAPFAPGGLGVREGVLVVALRHHAGLGGALALAAVARLVTTVAEVAAAVPFLLRTRKT